MAMALKKEKENLLYIYIYIYLFIYLFTYLFDVTIEYISHKKNYNIIL